MTARLAACCTAALLVYSPASPAQVGVEARAATIGQQPGAAAGPVVGLPFAPPPMTATPETGRPASQGEESSAEQRRPLASQEAATEPSRKLTVALLDDDFKLTLGGSVTADFFLNSARPVAPGTPYYLTPGPAPMVRQDTFDASARQTALFALVTGPKIGDFETGAQLRVNLYSNPIIADKYGIRNGSRPGEQ